MKKLTHTEVQKGASKALRMAMEKNVAHETRQVGDDIQITTVLDSDVEGTVLAVSYPDGGIDYYPTEISVEEKFNREVQGLARAVVLGDILDANVLTAEDVE